MSIRAMCCAFDVTPRTLRFYEQKDLLFPIRDGQKRLFTRRDRARLTLILRGRKFGVGLEEIRQLLDLYDMEGQKHVQLQKSIETGKRRLAEMIGQRAALDAGVAELRVLLADGEKMLYAEKAQSAA